MSHIWTPWLMKFIEDRSDDEGCPPKTDPEVGLGSASYPHPFGGKYIQTISISIPTREGFSPAQHPQARLMTYNPNQWSSGAYYREEIRMKEQPHFSKYLLRVIGLLLILLLASCEQLGQFIDLPYANGPESGKEIPGEISSLAYLSCPSIPNTNRRISLVPYNEEIGDCALIGKSEEIEAWLTELEGITESCRANRDPNWANTLASRDNLDAKIDGLEESGTLPSFFVICSWVEAGSLGSGVYNNTPPTHYYTEWLMSIGADVEKYCTMIDEIVKPLWLACQEINFYQDCQAPNPVQYHSLIKWQMNAAQIHYDYTEIFYTTNLQIDGWGNFRNEFNESSLAIDCLREQQATFTFSMNAFCRFGPSSKYEKVATFLELQSVQINGRSQSEPRWWWVLIPSSKEHCWVADSTGLAAGDLEGLKFVKAPPLVISPVNDNQEKDQPEANSCSKDLGPRACAAAGGTWTQSSAGPYYCDC